MATTKSYTKPKKGGHPNLDAAVLHFIEEIHAKGIPVITSYLRKKYKPWFLSENLLPAPSGKFKRASASKHLAWFSDAWKKIIGKTLKPLFEKSCITNAFDGTKYDMLLDNSLLDYPDLESQKNLKTQSVRLDVQLKKTVKR
jgi:hypothetical protein